MGKVAEADEGQLAAFRDKYRLHEMSREKLVDYVYSSDADREKIDPETGEKVSKRPKFRGKMQ